MTSLKVAETLKELRHHRGFTQNSSVNNFIFPDRLIPIMRMVRGSRIWKPPA